MQLTYRPALYWNCQAQAVEASKHAGTQPAGRGLGRPPKGIRQGEHQVAKGTCRRTDELEFH